LRRHSDCASRRFEHRFGNMMAISSMMQNHMQIGSSIASKRLPEMFNQFAVEATDFRNRDGRVVLERIPTAKIDCGRDQAFVHWQSEVTVSANASAVSECFIDRLS